MPSHPSLVEGFRLQIIFIISSGSVEEKKAEVSVGVGKNLSTPAEN